MNGLSRLGCPECDSTTRTVETRPDGERGLRRWRICRKCGLRFSTHETADGESEAIARREAAARMIVRRYLALNETGRRAVTAVLLAIEEAVKVGAAYEAEAVQRETPSESGTVRARAPEKALTPAGAPQAER